MPFPPLYLVTSWRKTGERARGSRYAGTHSRDDLWRVGMVAGYYPGQTLTFFFESEAEAAHFSRWQIYDPRSILQASDAQRAYIVGGIVKFPSPVMNPYTMQPENIPVWTVQFYSTVGRNLIDWQFPNPFQADQWSVGRSYRLQDMFGTTPALPTDISMELAAAAQRAAAAQANAVQAARADKQGLESQAQDAIAEQAQAVLDEEQGVLDEAGLDLTALEQAQAAAKGTTSVSKIEGYLSNATKAYNDLQAIDAKWGDFADATFANQLATDIAQALALYQSVQDYLTTAQLNAALAAANVDLTALKNAEAVAAKNVPLVQTNKTVVGALANIANVDASLAYATRAFNSLGGTAGPWADNPQMESLMQQAQGLYGQVQSYALVADAYSPPLNTAGNAAYAAYTEEQDAAAASVDVKNAQSYAAVQAQAQAANTAAQYAAKYAATVKALSAKYPTLQALNTSASDSAGYAKQAAQYALLATQLAGRPGTIYLNHLTNPLAVKGAVAQYFIVNGGAEGWYKQGPLVGNVPLILSATLLSQAGVAFFYSGTWSYPYNGYLSGFYVNRDFTGTRVGSTNVGVY